MGCDDLVFIDSDIEWQPEWFFRLLNYDVDVVGGTYPKKGDHEEYVVRKINNTDIDRTTGLLEVDGLGTGFIRLSKRAIQHLWDTSEPYVDKKDNLERRMVFDVVIIDHDMVSEDILMCMKLQDGGFKIYLDPTMTCNHIGTKKYTGDFKHWYNTLLRPSTIRKQL
jgi:glycosyltransferase involved in cell wall biosynthesis